MSTTAPRTLADQFRHWPDERLAALFAARPELATGAPTDSAALANRVAASAAVGHALTNRSRLELAILEASIQLAPTSVAALARHVNASVESIDDAVRRLIDLALLWGSNGAVRPVGGVPAALPSPAGPTPDQVPALVAKLSGAARALLDHLDASDAPGATSSITEPIQELLRCRLAVLDDRRMLVLPWTVRVALRGGRSTRAALDVPPEVATTERGQELIDRAAAGSAFAFVRRVESLLDRWGGHPPTALKTGGLSSRDLRSTAILLQVEVAEVALLLDVALAARLLGTGVDAETNQVWLPTDEFDRWKTLSMAERWTTLAAAWLDSTRATGLVGGRDEADRPINALVPELVRHWLPEVKRATMNELRTTTGSLAGGTGPATLIARLRWRTPRRGESHDRAVLWSLTESAGLGLTGLNGMSSFGRQLLAGDEPSTLAPLLPALVDHILLQADGTAIAPGPLLPDLARSISQIADVESSGGATVYRFTADSIRRGFDSGWSAAELKSALSDASRTPVPQSLEYLIDDVGRRFGTLRVGLAEAFIRSDDEAALSELVAGAAGLDLRRIAPTVVISGTPLTVLLPRLRELGLAPVVEAPDGSVQVARPDEQRTRAPKPRPASAAEAHRASAVARIVANLRAGDKLAATRPDGFRASTPGDVRSLLLGAIEEGHDVLLTHLDNHGGSTDRLIRPTRVEGGQLLGHSPGDPDDSHSIAIHRVSAARLAHSPTQTQDSR